MKRSEENLHVGIVKITERVMGGGGGGGGSRRQSFSAKENYIKVPVKLVVS